jgi:hypothetical protein
MLTSTNSELNRIIRTMPASARQAVLNDPKLANQLIEIYFNNPERLKYAGEVSCQSSLAFTRSKMRNR